MATTQRKTTWAVFGLGGLLIASGLTHEWLGERTFARMRDTTCTVLRKRVDLHLRVDPGGRRRRSARAAGYTEQAQLFLGFAVGGERYTFSEEFLRDWNEYASLGFEEGKAYPCRYDTEDPRRATVRRSFDSTTSEGISAA